MTTRLPLVAAQPGIWMAERLSTLPGAWSVAHYVELRGALDPTLLGKAIVAGLQQADTLSLRFEEEEGEVWQWLAADRTFGEPSIIDLRTAPDPHRAATERMQADLAQDLRVDGGNPLVCHQLLRVGDDRWYWYQRYHHLLVDGFSFPAITRQIAAIYRAWQRGEATPESPFTPFAEVVDEYQRYAGSEAWQRDKAFWQAQRQALPAPASLSAAPLGGRAAGSDIWRMKLEMNADAFRRLASHAPQCQPADLALALTTLWLGRLCNRMDYAAGFIFMRRMGSAALTSTGPVLNVLPLAVHIDARETLADLAMRLAAQLKKMRRHQRYDAEQIVRDSGKAAGDEPLFGPVLNVKVFDYQLDIDGVQAVTHTLATGPVNDLELALFPDETGGLSLEILANKARYDEAELRRHMARLTALLAQQPGLQGCVFLLGDQPCLTRQTLEALAIGAAPDTIRRPAAPDGTPGSPVLFGRDYFAALLHLPEGSGGSAVLRAHPQAIRLLPTPGKNVGDTVEMGGLLGSAPVMPVHKESSADFIQRGGRIPAPLHSLRN